MWLSKTRTCWMWGPADEEHAASARDEVAVRRQRATGDREPGEDQPEGDPEGMWITRWPATF